MGVESQFEFVEVGNTYSEYRCQRCGENIVVQMEDLNDKIFERHRRTCKGVS